MGLSKEQELLDCYGHNRDRYNEIISKSLREDVEYTIKEEPEKAKYYNTYNKEYLAWVALYLGENYRDSKNLELDRKYVKHCLEFAEKGYNKNVITTNYIIDIVANTLVANYMFKFSTFDVSYILKLQDNYDIIFSDYEELMRIFKESTED